MNRGEFLRGAALIGLAFVTDPRKLPELLAPTPEDFGPPVGSITAFLPDSMPEGWLPCDGRKVEMLDYPSLYQVIGKSYGLSSYRDTKFCVPNLRIDSTRPRTTEWRKEMLTLDYAIKARAANG